MHALDVEQSYIIAQYTQQPLHLLALLKIKQRAYEVSHQQDHSKKQTYWNCIKLIRLRNEYYLHWSSAKHSCFSQLKECIDSQSASIKSPDLCILRGRTYCLLIKPVCCSRMFHFLLEIALSNAGCLSQSWKRTATTQRCDACCPD